MGGLSPIFGIIGSIVSAVSTIAGGQQESAVADYEAEQLEVNAGQERAAAQRRAIEQRRQGRLVQSRQLALAAASGAGASDPTVLDLMTGTEAESEYRAMTELYEGEERARGLKTQANVRRFEGKQAKKTSMFGAIGNTLPTLLDSGSSLFERYG